MHACFFCETRYELLGIVLHSLRITGYYYLSHWLGDTKCYSNNYEMFTLWDQHNLWKPGWGSMFTDQMHFLSSKQQYQSTDECKFN